MKTYFSQILVLAGLVANLAFGAKPAHTWTLSSDWSLTQGYCDLFKKQQIDTVTIGYVGSTVYTINVPYYDFEQNEEGRHTYTATAGSVCPTNGDIYVSDAKKAIACFIYSINLDTNNYVTASGKNQLILTANFANVEMGHPYGPGSEDDLPLTVSKSGSGTITLTNEVSATAAQYTKMALILDPLVSGSTCEDGHTSIPATLIQGIRNPSRRVAKYLNRGIFRHKKGFKGLYTLSSAAGDTCYTNGEITMPYESPPGAAEIFGLTDIGLESTEGNHFTQEGDYLVAMRDLTTPYGPATDWAPGQSITIVGGGTSGAGQNNIYVNSSPCTIHRGATAVNMCVVAACGL